MAHHYFELPEVAKLLHVMHARQTPKAKIQHLAALTLFVTGTRVGQLLQIEGKDIFQRNGKWAVKLNSAKGGAEVVHDLRIDADPAFDMSPLIEMARVRRNSRIFGGLTDKYLNKLLKIAAPDAGIHPDYAHTHTLRHSIANVIWETTHHLGAITEYLGHKDPKTALYYVRANDGKRAQAAVNSMVLA